MEANGSSDIGHVIFVAWLQCLIVPGAFGSIALPRIAADAVQGHHCNTFRILRVWCGDHTTLSRRQRLCRIETKSSEIADGAYHPPLIFRGKCMGSIFDHMQAICLCNS